MTAVIRQATKDDFSALERLLKQGYPPSLVQSILAKFQERYENPEKQRSISFVACDDEALVGHSALTYNPTPSDAVNFNTLVVASSYRNAGIGTALLQHQIKYLQETGFAGTVGANPVTLHLGSQRICHALSFTPFAVQLASLEDHGIGQRETPVLFARHFVPDLPRTASGYFPKEYHALAQRFLEPFCDIELQESPSSLISERLQTFAQNPAQFQIPATIYPVRLHEENACAEFQFLMNNGYYLSGFYPLYEEGRIQPRAYMSPLPKEALDREKIKVIPAAQHLFDFVWGQYEQTRR